MEHSEAGLLGINRGLDTTAPLILPAPEDTEAWPATEQPAHWPRPALRHIAEFTNVVARRHPDAYLEWAVTEGRPHFIDHSIPKTHHTHQHTEDAITISPGTARGPLFRIEDTDELSELSIAPIVSIGSNAPVPASRYITKLLARVSAIEPKPIIYARRPYAILSMLMNHAAGFVFDGGSILCHLAILLREAEIPAIITQQPITDAQTVTIDAGTVYATRRIP
jgi:phosphohistidine swiveling domain-containing protein